MNSKSESPFLSIRFRLLLCSFFVRYNRQFVAQRHQDLKQRVGTFLYRFVDGDVSGAFVREVILPSLRLNFAITGKF